MQKVVVSKNGFFIFGCFFIITIMNYFLFGNFDNYYANEKYLFLLCWVANILFLLSSYMVYFLNKRIISLVNIVLLFGFLFNFGQTMLWSIGVHTNNEIGSVKLFSNFHIPNQIEICTAIKYSIVAYSFLVLGIVFAYCFEINNSINRTDSVLLKKIIYSISKYLSIVVIPLTFVKVIKTLIFSATNGYASIYYSNYSVSAVLDFAERLFFPVLVGILLGSGYKQVKLIYMLFALFSILYLFAGERGNWVYDLVILFWLHNRYYKKINIKKVIKVGILAFIFSYFLSIVVDFRGEGLFNISVSDIDINALVKSNPVFRFISEMGNSIGVTLIVLSYGKSQFSVSNTFVTSALVSVSSKFADVIGIQYQYISNYLSQELLHISYGTGFNFFAESYINGSFIPLFIFGIVIVMFAREKNKNGRLESLSLGTFVMIIITPTLCSCFRQESLVVFKSIMQIGILYPLFIWFCYKFILNHKSN